MRRGIISRTRGNAYDRYDVDRFVLGWPKLDKTDWGIFDFFDINDLIFCEDDNLYAVNDVSEIDAKAIIEKIQNGSL